MEVSRPDKRIYYRFRILRHDVTELTVFLGDLQGLVGTWSDTKTLHRLITFDSRLTLIQELLIYSQIMPKV